MGPKYSIAYTFLEMMNGESTWMGDVIAIPKLQNDMLSMKTF
jgi:hypothetical protein